MRDSWVSSQELKLHGNSRVETPWQLKSQFLSSFWERQQVFWYKGRVLPSLTEKITWLGGMRMGLRQGGHGFDSHFPFFIILP
jgi:hypothetical protein